MRWCFIFFAMGPVMWAPTPATAEDKAITAVAEPLATDPGATQRGIARERYQAGDYAGTVAAALTGLAALPGNEADPLGRAGLLQWAGVGAEALGDYPRARERLEASLALYRAAGSKREVAATLNSLAAVYARQSEPTKQLAALIEAHGIFEALGEVRGRAALANSLGNYFSEMKEPAKALPYHEQSVALRRTLDQPVFLAAGLENLGITLRENARDAAARKIYEEALAIYREAKDEEGLAGVLTNLGSLTADEGEFTSALAFYEEALRYDRAAGYKPGEAILLRNIGATLRRAGRTTEAIKWLDQAVALATELADPERIVSAREERAGALEAAGRPGEALADLREAAAVRIKRETETRQEALLDLQTRFETVQKEREIERLERVAVERELGLTRSEAARETAEQARVVERAQRRTAFALAIGAAVAAVLLALAYYVKQRAAQRLARQRAELAAALAELHAANAELKRLYARKSEWLGFAVHDLRSPLFAIDGLCAEVACDTAESPVHTVAEIRSAAGRMRRELDEWLEAERREQDELKIQPVKTDLGALVAAVLELNQPAARAKKLTLTHRAIDVSCARVDPWRWREVVDNLISNAIKFSPPGLGVLVETGASGGQAWCRVTDGGPGISDEDRVRLFGAYARLSAQPTAGEPSSGLGLHLVKRIVDAHGGRIKVTRAASGGAVFEVSVAVTS